MIPAFSGWNACVAVIGAVLRGCLRRIVRCVNGRVQTFEIVDLVCQSAAAIGPLRCVRKRNHILDRSLYIFRQAKIGGHGSALRDEYRTLALFGVAIMLSRSSICD